MANQGLGGIAINSSNLFGGLDGRPMGNSKAGGFPSPKKNEGGSVLNQAGKSILGWLDWKRNNDDSELMTRVFTNNILKY